MRTIRVLPSARPTTNPTLFERFARTMTAVPVYTWDFGPTYDVAHVSAMGTTTLRLQSWGA